MKVLEMVTQTQKWPIQSIEIPDKWSHKSGKFVILGDAAHAMLPNMALGNLLSPKHVFRYTDICIG
jgi:salicylate hydroxylase